MRLVTTTMLLFNILQKETKLKHQDSKKLPALT